MKKQILLLLIAILSLGTGIAQINTSDKYEKKLNHLLDSLNTHIYPGTIVIKELSKVNTTDKQFKSVYLNSYMISKVGIENRVLMPLQPITVKSMLDSPEYDSHKASILRKVSSSDTRAYSASVEIDNTTYPIYFLLRPEDAYDEMFSNPLVGLFNLNKKNYDQYKK